MPDINEALCEQRIRNHLPDPLQAIDIFVFDTIDSTNNYAKKLILDGAAGFTAVLAEHQSAGRGRRGRSFFSPANTGLYLSLILPPHLCQIEEIQRITMMSAVAVRRAIAALTDSTPSIKWVNDIFINDKKVCGILAEVVSTGNTVNGVVVGIGINCSTQDFPEELNQIAGSLDQTDISRNLLTAQIISNIATLTNHLHDPAILADYRLHSYTLGKTVSFRRNGADITAIACGINDCGNLIVKEPDGIETTLFWGEAVIL